MKKTTVSQRFWSKVNFNGPVPISCPHLGSCWLWTAGQFSNGYGQFSIKAKKKLSHRISYQYMVGTIPDGLDLDHICRVRNCVNPAHLEPVTRKVNLRRGNTIPAKNAAKKKCPNGHPYSGGNLYVDPRGGRFCRICKNETWRRWYERHRA